MTFDLEKLISLTKAERNSEGYIGHCLAHDDEHPSFSFKVVNSKLICNCFSGCTQEEIFYSLKKNNIYQNHPKENKGGKKKKELILQIYHESLPISSENAAGKYLLRRGISLNTPSEDIRFHPSLWHSETQMNHPALIGVIRRKGEIIGLQRTFLTPDGKKIAQNPKKDLGEKKGGCVHV